MNDMTIFRPKSIATPADVVGLPAEVLDMMDYSVIPTIVNDGEMFKVRNSSWKPSLISDGFDAIILDQESYEYHKCSDSNHAVPGYYTRDGETDQKGEPISATQQMWADDGLTFTKHEYLQFKVFIVSPEPLFRQMALVTISPTSVKRARAYIAIDLKLSQGLEPWQAITHFGLAESVRSRSGKSYHPWALHFVRPVEAEAEETA